MAESWMALPLFNRQNSPESSRDVLSTASTGLLSVEPSIECGERDNSGQVNPHNLPGQLQLPADLNPGRVAPSTHLPDWTRRANPESRWMQCGELEVRGPGAVTCPFPGCKSTLQFTGSRELQRHYRQHFKRYFCRYPHCPQAGPGPEGRHPPTKRGFATRKDRARHEAKHDPRIKCPCLNERGERCSRMFSRIDNMRDHVRRIHNNSHDASQEIHGTADANPDIDIHHEA
ncbi:hypothetical protein BDV32DRAFT_156532 [Aspergillus pseudonomiae]|uniref:Uncharacterized protein n=1 Tax=Aspergillus pseudonomiae TaxID=1506151 RepID=A0A5N6HKD5_9EURO|nr:uncharacterized protein BDV37DRAFT_112480 [Aspergillus pseudonomiae]KAB8254982.1 hypothetical protein BDV32DRAFT_156532 [Aspergillus pseudonomiae]KAE8409382.1 hypothetical protein BDV37DRAFT_112480 [Aspergillus pseudonomiae]